MVLLEFASGFQDTAVLFLRVVLGFIMLVHGFPKIGGPVRPQMRNAMKGVGVPGPLFDLVAVLEVVGGIALILGLLTRVAALLFAVQMVGTIVLYLTKLGTSVPPPEMLQQMVAGSRRVLRGFIAGVGGWEFDLLILGAAVVLLTTGAGPYSVDALLGL
ncbi:MAG: DoxX family protein [Candidatus Caldarchaeum sp.]|nr:DoxX family protein [Candidatus Caldarchaeum sp.]MDW8434618.1 DoxX family protein [Candidatus Caldarchaeum sp.]